MFALPWPTRPPTPAAAAKIQNDLRILTERLARINDNLARKISSRNEYDKTIQETEAAYAKVQPHGAAPPHRLSSTATRLDQRAAKPALALPLRPLLGVGRGCVRAARACRLLRAILTMTIPTMADHGELANAAARAQAGERQPHEEEAGVLVGASASVLFGWVGVEELRRSYSDSFPLSPPPCDVSCRVCLCGGRSAVFRGRRIVTTHSVCS